MWLVTAGPTREYLDDVRFLTNASSGRMGYAIARAAAARGHEVVLVSGPVSLAPPPAVEVLPVETAAEMLDAARLVLELRRPSVMVGAAAVCDFRPSARIRGKPPKEQGRFALELVENPDVIESLAALGIARSSIGFALEDLGQDDAGLAAAEERARAKLARKHLDAIVLNGTETLAAERCRAWWIPDGGDAIPFGDLAKDELARHLIGAIEAS